MIYDALCGTSPINWTRQNLLASAPWANAESGPQLLSDACNHCVVVVDTTGELGGFWSMRTWPKTCQYEAERVARINQEKLFDALPSGNLKDEDAP